MFGDKALRHGRKRGDRDVNNLVGAHVVCLGTGRLGEVVKQRQSTLAARHWYLTVRHLNGELWATCDGSGEVAADTVNVLEREYEREEKLLEQYMRAKGREV